MSSDNPTREEVLASIVPNSEQINAEDCAATGPITVTVKAVRRGSKEQPIFIDLVEHDREYRPCKTCRRILIAAWSDDPVKWIGQRITLFCDPSIVFGGIKVGGLRISRLSGIDKDRVFMLSTSRGKKAEVVIQPLADSPEPTEKERLYIDEITKMIAAVTTLEELANLGVMMADKSAPIKEALRGLYGARKAELQSKVLEPGG
jgi:hypothetical protein